MAFRVAEMPRVAVATKELATQYANMGTIVNDRSLRAYRLAHYRKEWAAGEFIPVQWATCHCKETDLNYRVNGKHTSVMICSLDVIPLFYVILIHFEADTIQDVVSLYTKFDPGIAGKSTGDINKVYAGSIPELEGVPERIINICITGINYAMNTDRAWVPQPETRAKVLMLPGTVEFILWANSMLAGKHYTAGKPMRRCGLLATMYLTHQRDPDAADRFWPSVRDETGLKPTLPDRKLAKFITTHNIDNGTKAKKQSPQATYREFHVKAIHAWNAWRKNMPTNLNYYPDKPIPPIV